MKKRLFNIHKLIGINVLLFFFISLFFGLLTILQPYVNIWEDEVKHINEVKIENINLDKCLKQATKRVFIDEKGNKVPNDFIKMSFPIKQVHSTNLVQIINRPNFYLNPNTCKRVRPKTFEISKFFDYIHTGGIFSSLLMKILFGFMSVAVVFLCLTGLFMIIKIKYKNSKTKTLKGFYAKYHRLLLVYTLPLVFMFGLTGALFNLGVYSTPLLTNYLTHGKTSNIFKVEKNILVMQNLENKKNTKKVKTLDLNLLYKKALKEFDDAIFYEMQVYNYNDINARIKFVAYEPYSFFISSMFNKSYIVLNGVNGKVIEKKLAKEGAFVQKALDSIFYLHYLRTFSDLARIVFFFICLFIFTGLSYAMFLWIERSKKDKFSYKVLKPLSFGVILGSVLSVSSLFASSWLITKPYMHFNLMNNLFNTQEVLFYLIFLVLFIYILIKKDLFIITKQVFLLSSICLIIAVISHQIFSGVNILNFLEKDLKGVFFTDLSLTIIAILFFIISNKIPKKYFQNY